MVTLGIPGVPTSRERQDFGQVAGFWVGKTFQRREVIDTVAGTQGIFPN